jgi:hypothetical protein
MEESLIALLSLFFYGGLTVGALGSAIAYTRWIVSLLLREAIPVGPFRFISACLVSLDALALHTLLRAGAAETQRLFPLFTPAALCLLFLLGALSVANLAVLAAQRDRLRPNAQAGVGVILLLVATVVQGILYSEVQA